MAVVENTLNASQVFMSAWIPAPPPESDPVNPRHATGKTSSAGKREGMWKGVSEVCEKVFMGDYMRECIVRVRV